MYIVRLLLTIAFLGATNMVYANGLGELPQELKTCVAKGIKAAIENDKRDRAGFKAMFLANIDAERMGYRMLKRAWRDADPHWRATALELYFNLVYKRGFDTSQAIGTVDESTLKIRLVTERPEIKPADGWHVTVSIETPREPITLAALVTKACKIVDLARGAWVSQFIDANDVDYAVRERKQAARN